MKNNKIVFATNNEHKLQEVRHLLEPEFQIVSLKEMNCFDDIAETALTLEGNALLKADYIFEKYGVDCISDDTGLEIDALGGEPGVFSARYAGEGHNAVDNMNKVLTNLSGCVNRKACFRTVVVLKTFSETKYFEGKVCGTIVDSPRGENGFGYDPIFMPDGYDKVFAELDLSVKNTISHRALAVQKLVEYLKK